MKPIKSLEHQHSGGVMDDGIRDLMASLGHCASLRGECVLIDATEVGLAGRPSAGVLRESSWRSSVKRPREGLLEACETVDAGTAAIVVIDAESLPWIYTDLKERICGKPMPLVIVLRGAGLLDRPGSVVRASVDAALALTLPGIKLYTPASLTQLELQVYGSLVADEPSLVRFPWRRLPRGEGNAAPRETIAQRRGSSQRADALLIACGAAVELAEQATDLLAQRGVEANVVAVPALAPLDRSELASRIAHHSLVVSVDDHAVNGGLASCVGPLVQGPDTQFVAIGWPDASGTEAFHGDLNDLRIACGMYPGGIAARVGQLVGEIGRRRGRREARAIEVDTSRAAEFIEGLKTLELNEEFERLIDDYERVGERNRFLWRWVRRGVEITTLSCVEPELWDHLCDTKSYGVMFDVLVDDVADQNSDPEFLEMLIGITRGEPIARERIPEHRREYFDFTQRVWNTIWERLRGYPRFAEFEDILRFDYRQLMTSMRYSLLIRDHPFIMNVTEHDAYLPHNMHMVASGTADVMASPSFDVAEMGLLRKVLLRAQYMGRIGNLVTTWEREINERDYSSGVFAVALARGLLTLDDLREGDPEKLRRRIRESDIEERFLWKWRWLHDRIVEQSKRFRSVDLGELVHGLETLIQLHLGSRGLK